MVRKSIVTAVAGVILATLAGCSGRKSSQSLGKMIEMPRLDSVVVTFGKLTPAQQDSIIGQRGEALSDYLYMMGLTSPDLKGSIDTLASSAAFGVFMPDIASKFSGGDTLRSELFKLEEAIGQKLQGLPPANYYGVTSPYRQSVMLVDSTVFIALNHYLGADYGGYGSMPEYARITKTRERIPYDVVRARLMTNYDIKGDAEDVASRLLHEGAIDYATMSLIDGANVATMLGWTPEQLAQVERSEREIWEVMVMRNLIYSTDPVDQTRLFDASPATAVISPELPGGVGRYIGMRIIESYVKSHPDVTLDELLQPEFALNRDNFLSAGYSPK